MRDAFLLIAAAIVSYLGFVCFALSQSRHWRIAVDAGEPRRRVVVGLRVGGALMLFIGFGLTLLRDGAAFGSLLGGVLISVAAVGVAFSVTWWPQPLKWIGRLLRGDGPPSKLQA